jgi:hydrogenase nickel incorporation protein HypA/HybF
VHELSIANSIVRVVERHAAGRTVTRVEIKVGHLRQVVPSALEFAFELVAEGTCAEGAELVLHEVRAAGVCRNCGAESELPAFPLRCSACGSFDVDVIRGEELLVDSLELEEALATIGGGSHPVDLGGHELRRGHRLMETLVWLM